MKIALITIWHANNYGAELQTYASVRALRELGHDVTVLNYRLNSGNKYPLKTKIAAIIQNITPASIKFERFFARHIPYSKRCEITNDLNNICASMDAIIVGSDQVWNPAITQKNALVYFLNFGSKSVKRFSYGSSFGEAKWNHPELTSNVKELLCKFTAISCREITGVNILSEVFDIKAVNVLDPTLLHANYNELTGPISDKGHVACYILNYNEQLTECAKKISKQLKCKFQDVGSSRKVFNKLVWNRPSIQDWIRNIAGASFVITESFHGLAMSLLYKRNFIIVQCSNRNHRSSRIIDLLNLIGLEDRYYTSCDKAMAEEKWREDINYDDVYAKLNRHREVSWSFLKQIK